MRKLTIAVMAAAALLATENLKAQTNAPVTTNAVPNLLATTNTPIQIAQTFWDWISPVVPFAVSNKEATVSAGFGYQTGEKHWMYGIEVDAPMAKNVSITAVGGREGGQWLYGGGTLTVGLPLNLYFTTVTTSVGDGPVYDAKNGGMSNYIDNKYDKEWTINKTISIGCGVEIFNIASQSGVGFLGGAHVKVLW